MACARSWLLPAVAAIAACTGRGPADEAQRAVAGSVDCNALGAAIGVDAAPALEQRYAPIGAPLDVRLTQLQQVSAALPPGRKGKAQGRFAGLVPFMPSESGPYAVLVASMAWADVGEAQPPRLVEPRSFHWITLCGTKFKTGLYTLQAGKAHFVQLWDSPDRELRLMIRKLP